MDVLRLIDAFQGVGLFVGSVCVTKYTDAPEVTAFEPVSYTHLDVYKRQGKLRPPALCADSPASGGVCPQGEALEPLLII